MLGVLIGLVIAGVALLAYQQTRAAPAHSEGKTDIDLTVLKESMEDAQQLSTAQYLYTDSVSVTDQNTLGIIGRDDIALPFTDATYILQFDGTISAGYELSGADVGQEGEGTVVVTLPPVEVLSHETGDVQVVYEQQNILNPLHLGEESSWIEGQKEAMEARAVSLGLYEKAQQNAKATFESLFENAIPKGVTLEVRFQESE